MKTTLTIILSIISFSIFAQDPPIKWKEIPIEDLKMTSYDLDPSAPAVVLCDYGNIDFNINPHGTDLFVFYRRHVRIKILGEQGLKYSKVSIPFHDMYCDKIAEKTSGFIQGMVYNLDSKGKLKAMKLRPKDITYRDSTYCNKIADITFPDVKPGSIIEYSYKIPSLDFMQPKSWYFQREIPTRLSEFRMKVPDEFEYLISPQNTSDFDINEESFFNYSIILSLTSSYYYLNSQNISRNPKESNIIAISGKQIRLAKNNIEAFKCNGFINRAEDYLSKLNIHLAKVIQKNSTDIWKALTYSLMITLYEDYDEYDYAQRSSLNYPSGYKIYTLPDWEKFNSNLLNSRKFGLPLITYWKYEDYLTDILKDKINPPEKTLAIYDYIRKNIKWNKEYNNDVRKVHGKFISKMYTKVTNEQMKEKSLAEPFENKEGSNSEINFLLIYLLNKAGIEAHPVILSTRDNGKIDDNIPELNQFNHIIAYVDLGENQILLDATDSLRPHQFLDKNDLNSVGYLVRGKDFGWINIANNRIPESNIAESISIDPNLNIIRKTNISDNIYAEIEHRKKIMLEGKDKFLKEYITQFSGFNSNSQADIKNFENDSLPLLITLLQKSQLPENEETNIQTNFVPAYTPQDFTDLERKCPVDFNYPFKQNYFLQIDLPEGYTVKLPGNEELSLYGNHASYKYSANLTGNKIMVKLNLQILLNEFPNQEYENLKELFTKLDEKLKENILIRKSE